MSEAVFLAYLFGSERNSATFGFGGSKCDKMYTPEIDIRTPSLVSRTMLSYMLEAFDRDAAYVNSWPKLYQWLGRQLPGQGWACFTQASANELVPHWFSETAEYRCRQPAGGGLFLDIDLFGQTGPGLDA